MSAPLRRRCPTVRLELAESFLTPGRRLDGEILLCGGDTAVDIESVWALLFARVYRDFDDDTGARQVRLFDGSISPGFRLAARQHLRIALRLPVAWHTPVTRVGDEVLRGASLILTVWPKTTVMAGDAIVFLQAEPLPWQRKLLDACRQAGLRLGEINPLGITQILDLRADDPTTGPLQLYWKVQRRRVTVGLSRRFGGGYTELCLPHEQAESHPWEQTLSGWLGRS